MSNISWPTETFITCLMAASPLHKTYVCNIKGNGKVILCNDKVKDFKKFGFQVLKIYSGISDEKQV